MTFTQRQHEKMVAEAQQKINELYIKFQAQYLGSRANQGVIDGITDTGNAGRTQSGESGRGVVGRGEEGGDERTQGQEERVNN